MEYDVFIIHASEDKSEVAAPLAQALIDQGLRVWFDEFELKLGDSLRRNIGRGLSETRFGVVILGPHFLRQQWPQIELDALLVRDIGEKKAIILPVWHNLSIWDVAHFSPALAERVAVSTEQGIAAVAKAIAEAVLIKAQGESQSAATRLESIVERLERLERSQSITGTFDTARQAPRQEAPKEAFIVHGHDLAARESVRRFLEKIGVRPIVLSEQPSHGHTVIEKLEAYSHVAFAIVLLTPDDMGGVSIPPGELGHRARQNVIFELGYFLGKLDRTRFCILNKGSLEIPSGIHLSTAPTRPSR